MKKIVAKKKYRYPMGLEREYAKQLRFLTDEMFGKIQKTVPQMVAIIKKNRINLDADDPNDDIDEYMEYLASILQLRKTADPYVRKMWQKVNKFTDTQIREIYEALFGSSVSMRGLKAEWTKRQIINEMTEEAERYGIELTDEEKYSIGAGILLSSILSASDKKRKAIENIIKNRPAGADIIASSEADLAIKAQAKLKQMEEIWVRENLDLISSLEAESLRKLRWKLSQMVAGGVPEENLTEELTAYLRDELKVEENRAVLIGSDQVGKLNGRMMQYYQQAAGVEEYRWQTMQDDRVRPSHRARQGKIFRWDEPPEDGHPGEAIRCRCVADPVIPLDNFGVNPKANSYIYVD